MSRNFELMQQLEMVSPVEVREVISPEIHEIEAVGTATRDEQWVGNEALSIVQRIFLPQKQDSPRVVAFAGVNHGDGCTRICAGVAESLADNGYGPVCIVEANFRSPALSGVFGHTNQKGLSDALLKDGPIRSYARPVGVDGLWLISCGGNAINWPDLLSSERAKPRVEELRKEFSYVVIDTPPLMRCADAVAIGQLADGVVLVLGAESTRRESAQMATATLRSAKIPILGAVLNKRTFPIPEQIYKRI
jgi:protein-tyrosine kinase